MIGYILAFVLLMVMLLVPLYMCKKMEPSTAKGTLVDRRYWRSALVVFLIGLLFFLSQSPGTYGFDPGPNEIKMELFGSASFEFTVRDPPWYSSDVRFWCYYTMTTVETTTCSFIIRNSTHTITAGFTITSTSPFVQLEGGRTTVQLGPGLYEVDYSSSRGGSMHTVVTQTHVDVRTEDQIFYDSIKGWVLIGAIAASILITLGGCCAAPVEPIMSTQQEYGRGYEREHEYEREQKDEDDPENYKLDL